MQPEGTSGPQCQASPPRGGQRRRLLVVELEELVTDFADGLKRADQLAPQWSSRSGRLYSPGIGPHAEVRAVELILDQMRGSKPLAYAGAGPHSYPGSREICDLCVGDPLEWAVEIKMARAFGDNGKLDDTWLKDLLSPYQADHSALSDAGKLRRSGFECRRAVLVYGFNYPARPLEPVLRCLELLMADSGPIAHSVKADFADLVHKVHTRGRVTAWEILSN